MSTNPDGREAAAAIERLVAELERWKRLKGYADDQIKVERKAYRSLLADYEARTTLEGASDDR